MAGTGQERWGQVVPEGEGHRFWTPLAEKLLMGDIMYSVYLMYAMSMMRVHQCQEGIS
jgi:hypothetical protein